MFVGGTDPKNVYLPLRTSFLFSTFNTNDVEKLTEIRQRREKCSLALLGSLSEKMEQKVIAVGGHFNPLQGEYQAVCEIFDLLLDIWKQNSKLKFNRLSPFVIGLGNDSALIVGGYQMNHNTKIKTVIKECEIINTKTKSSYIPKSKYKVPENAS